MNRPTNRELREYYTRKAVEVDELRATYEHPSWYKRAFYQARFRAVFEALGPRPGEMVLDLGSGPGYYSYRIAEAGAFVVSADLAPTYLGKIPSHVSARVAADAQQLPLRSGTFDRVLATEVLEHTLRPERLVDEVARVLKTGGRAVITCPSCNSYMDRLYEVKSRVRRYDFVEHVQEFDRARFSELVSRHFRILDFRFANCLVAYPLDSIAMKIPERLGLPIFSKLERAFAQGKGGPALCWTMIAILERP